MMGLRNSAMPSTSRGRLESDLNMLGTTPRVASSVSQRTANSEGTWSRSSSGIRDSEEVMAAPKTGAASVMPRANHSDERIPIECQVGGSVVCKVASQRADEE